MLKIACVPVPYEHHIVPQSPAYKTGKRIGETRNLSLRRDDSDRSTTLSTSFPQLGGTNSRSRLEDHPHAVGSYTAADRKLVPQWDGTPSAAGWK